MKQLWARLQSRITDAMYLAGWTDRDWALEVIHSAEAESRMLREAYSRLSCHGCGAAFQGSTCECGGYDFRVLARAPGKDGES